jgi:hypothetical protein
MTDHPAPRSPYLLSVHTLGQLALALGAIELVYRNWMAPQGHFRIDILWLVVGVLLINGNRRVLAVLRWLALLGVIPATLGVVQQLVLPPLDLTLTQLSLRPGQFAHFFLPLLIQAGMVCLIAWRLNQDDVKSALAEHGRPAGSVKLPLALGALLLAGGTAWLVNALNGPDARAAERLAAQRMGAQYRYFTSHLHYMKDKSTTVTATVQVWNDRESWQVPVKWEKR